jgi:hypothetical protein
VSMPDPRSDKRPFSSGEELRVDAFDERSADRKI